MPCTTQRDLTPTAKQAQAAALARLEKGLGLGAIRAVVGSSGSIAFAGWQDNSGISDLCAYKALAATNSPELRRAVARAEAISGYKVKTQAIAAGHHSHDGGKTWGTH